MSHKPERITGMQDTSLLAEVCSRCPDEIMVRVMGNLMVCQGCGVTRVEVKPYLVDVDTGDETQAA